MKLIIFLLLIATGFASSSSNIQTSVKERPNILIILGDDVGTGDIPVYWDSSLVSMPNIDKLASNGLTFKDAHSSPACAPSRYMLLSGNYAHRGRMAKGTYRFEGNGNQFYEGQKSIAEVLRDEAGYNTAMFGKWHLGVGIPRVGKMNRSWTRLESPINPRTARYWIQFFSYNAWRNSIFSLFFLPRRLPFN